MLSILKGYTLLLDVSHWKFDYYHFKSSSAHVEEKYLVSVHILKIYLRRWHLNHVCQDCFGHMSQPFNHSHIDFVNCDVKRLNFHRRETFAEKYSEFQTPFMFYD